MPTDTGRVGTVAQHWSAALGEIIPNPIHERVDLDPQTAQQSDMDAEPHAVGSHALKLVAMLADLGYRGIPANHHHDPLIMVVKSGMDYGSTSTSGICGRSPASGRTGIDHESMPQRQC